MRGAPVGTAGRVFFFRRVSVPQTPGKGRLLDVVRNTWAQIEPLTRGQYVNLATTDDRETRIHAAYGDNYPRLAELKKRYDPKNLFRLNANIKPA